ncbi:transglutaminase-like domain-containing protein [Falsihalocynthiibacter arcticus]|uniref:Transglutaminase n=1 Tax=Falsihalocynthiibacter arcticus TaxID=1579316 RepID=A0A126V3S0_9RHOB|nr:transglutaminase family protein [Falsihalocynthiibacter arcticus]AML52964.1 transglutaminase [Falsihalocynthiibacter arcticus]
MELLVKVHLVYSADQPSDILLQIEAAQGNDQVLLDAMLDFTEPTETFVVAGEENIGVRRWLKVDGQFDCTYVASVDVVRVDDDLADCAQAKLSSLPSDVTKFLMPSRYCHPEDFFAFTADQFEHLSGGAVIKAMSNWINTHFKYDTDVSNAATSASQSFELRAGVCRDFAHVLIAMARAVGIPARIVSAYAPDVSPQDFHAVTEVYLENRWQLIDSTGMARASEIVRIGVGRDAADVSFLTSYGALSLKKQTVEVSRIVKPS